MIRCPEFSNDALQAAMLWKTNPYLTLAFNTPSKRHPRLIAALEELIREGIIGITTEARSGKVTYSCPSRDKLNTVPKISQKACKADPLPMTVD